MIKILFSFLFIASLAYGQGSDRALSFDDTQAQYVSLSSPATLMGHTALTAELWVKRDDVVPIDQFESFVSVWDASLGTSNGWWFGISNVHELEFYVQQVTTVVRTPTNQLFDGDWHHVACTFVGGSSMTIYMDGVQVATLTTGVPATIATVAAPAHIGGQAVNGANYYEGTLDEVRIWDRALSQDEIRQKMCEKLSGTEPGLLSYYRMDEGADGTCAGGQDVCDASGKGNHGTKF